jgi:DNA-binding CsgD family transcriptional regulator
MEIIVRNNIEMRVEKIGPYYEPRTPSHQRWKNITEQNKSHDNLSIEILLAKLNQSESYDNLPHQVIFDCNVFEARGIDVQSTLNLIQLTSDLSANRFNKHPRKIEFIGFAHKPISYRFHSLLKSCGWSGIIPTIREHGWQRVVHAVKEKQRLGHCSWYDDLIFPPTLSDVVPATTKVEIKLSFRQHQIANLIAKRGLTNQQIASQLKISESAVKLHVGLLLKKYGIQNRTQISLAIEAALVIS